MFTPFVSDEKPVAIYEGAPPQYSSDGLAIDCALVLQTDISLTDLAYKYNFSSPSAFSDYFRRCTGISPRSTGR